MNGLVSKKLFQTIFVLSLSLLLFDQCQSSELDLAEIESIYYDVNIGGTPLLEHNLASQVSYLIGKILIRFF